MVDFFPCLHSLMLTVVDLAGESSIVMQILDCDLAKIHLTPRCLDEAL